MAVLVGVLEVAPAEGLADLGGTVTAGFGSISEAAQQAVIVQPENLPPDSPWASPVVRGLTYFALGGALFAAFLVAWTVTLRSQVAAKTADLVAAQRHLGEMIDNIPGLLVRLRYPPEGGKQLLFVGGANVKGAQSAEVLATVSPDEFVAMFHPDDRHMLFVELPDKLRRDGEAVHTYRVVSPDGAVHWKRSWERVVEWDGDAFIAEAVVFDISEEIEAKQDATAKDQWLRAILDNIPDTAWLKDRDGRIVAANRACAHACGLADPADIVGRTDFTLFPAEAAERHRAEDVAVMDSGRSSRFEEVQTLVDGSTVWLDTIKRPVFDDDNRLIGTVGIARDVTGRKAMERSLREAKRRLETLIANVPGIVFRKSYGVDDSRIVFVNDHCREMMGYTAGEICAMSQDQRQRLLWQAADDALTPFDMSSHIKAGNPSGEYRAKLRRPDGTTAWVLIRETVVARTPEETIVEGLMLDITAEVEANRALAAREAEFRELALRLQTIVESVPGAVYTKAYVKGEFRYEYVSPRYLELTGGRAPQLADSVENRLDDYWHPEDWDALRTFNAQMSGGAPSGEVRARLRRKDGSWLWVYVCERMEARSGDTIISSGLMLDISAEMEARHALEREETQRRTAEERLRESLRLAALGRLAGGVAHDFNNILGAILGFGTLVLEDSPAGLRSHQHAGHIVRAARRGKDLVDRLLTLAGKVKPRLAPLPLYRTVSEALDEVRTALPAKIALEMTVESDTTIRADRRQFCTALQNLVFNATESLGDGRGTVRVTVALQPAGRPLPSGGVQGDLDIAVSLWRRPDGSACAITGRLPPETPVVSVMVADDGPGMDDTLLAQSFAPFFSTKERALHAGLGLPVVQGVVLSHGGALIVVSRPGEGTSAEMLIPVTPDYTEVGSQGMSRQ